jgi:hypothetical protein
MPVRYIRNFHISTNVLTVSSGCRETGLITTRCRRMIVVQEYNTMVKYKIFYGKIPCFFFYSVCPYPEEWCCLFLKENNRECVFPIAESENYRFPIARYHENDKTHQLGRQVQESPGYCHNAFITLLSGR